MTWEHNEVTSRLFAPKILTVGMLDKQLKTVLLQIINEFQKEQKMNYPKR